MSVEHLMYPPGFGLGDRTDYPRYVEPRNDAGYFYTPHVPLLDTPRLLDRDSFAPADNGAYLSGVPLSMTYWSHVFSPAGVSAVFGSDVISEPSEDFEIKVNWKKEGF